MLCHRSREKFTKWANKRSGCATHDPLDEGRCPSNSPEYLSQDEGGGFIRVGSHHPSLDCDRARFPKGILGAVKPRHLGSGSRQLRQIPCHC